MVFRGRASADAVHSAEVLAPVTSVEPAACPPADALALLARGEADAQASGLRAHLDDCDECRVVVARLVSPTGVAPAPQLVADRYRIGRLLGRGGMGEVYEAWDTNLERRVALKTLGPRAEGGDVEEVRRNLARLVRESKAMARVRHPNVVAVYDAGAWQGRAFVVMELVDGETLRSWCLRAPRSWPEVLALYVAAGRGLHAANAQGIVHRDFKPDNVLVDEHARVQVTDFGLAQWSEGPGAPATGSIAITTGSIPIAGASPGLDDSGSLTQSGAAVGTPAYMAPEQFRGEALDARADVFAFCVALYEALAGTRPFAGADVRALVLAQRHGATDDGLRARGVPRWCAAAILSGLQFDRRARPADMAALLRRLEPPARRGRLAAVVLAGAAVAGVGFFAARPRDDTPCVGDPLATIWDARAQASFAAADPATRSFASTRLASWVEQWRGAWSNACAAGDAAAAELRRACLLGQRASFAAIVRGLREAEFDVVAAERGLPRSTACDGGPALAQRMPEPDDPELAARVGAVRVELAELEGLAVMERAEALADRCAAALEQARAIGFRPLEAEATMVFAGNRVVAGELVEARRMLVSAAQIASASGHDSAAARAWSLLVELEADHLADYARGQEYADNAQAAIDRLGPSEEADRRRLDLHFARGLLAYRRGEQDVAAAEFDAAEALARRVEPDDLLAVLEGKAIVLEDRGEFERAIQIHTEVAERRRAEGGDAHPQLFISYANLASVHVMLGHSELALAAARRSTEVALASRGPDHVDYATALHNEGEVLRSVGRFEDALLLLERARAVFAASLGDDSPKVASTLEHEAGVLQGLRRFDEAVGLMRRALEIFDRRGPAQHVATTRANLADLLRDAGRPADGLADANAAVEVLLPALPGAPETAYALMVQGEILVDLGRAGDAIAPLERALAICRDGGFLPLETGVAQFVLARALLATAGDRARALALASDAARAWHGAPAPWNFRREQLEQWRRAAFGGMSAP